MREDSRETIKIYVSVDLSFDRIDTHTLILRIPRETFIFKISHALSFFIHAAAKSAKIARIIFLLSS